MIACRYCSRPSVWHARVREQISDAEITTDISLCPAHLARVAISPRLQLLWLRRLAPDLEVEIDVAEEVGSPGSAS